MKITALFCLTLAAFTLGGCNNDRLTNSSTGPDRTSLPGTPAPANASAANANSNMAKPATGPGDFWSEAASGGLAEVEAGKLASTKATNAVVKSYAQMMVTDHTKANDELKALATKKNITLPTAPAAKHQAKMAELQGLSGAEFDRAYVNAMVADHEATVQLFESQAQSGTDAEAKAFAEKSLPTLRKHLETIKGIQAKVK